MKETTCPPDFYPEKGCIDCLSAWGMVNPPKGDQLCGEWFITRKDVIADFIYYWTWGKGKGKAKKDWQRTYINSIKNIAWPNELRAFENNRHKRPDNGSGGFKRATYIPEYHSGESVVERRYRIPTDEESIGKFKQLEAEMLK